MGFSVVSEPLRCVAVLAANHWFVLVLSTLLSLGTSEEKEKANSMALYLLQHQIDDPLSISTPKSYRILRHALCKHLGINNLRNLSNSCIELHSNPCTLGGSFYIQIRRIRRNQTRIRRSKTQKKSTIQTSEYRPRPLHNVAVPRLL